MKYWKNKKLPESMKRKISNTLKGRKLSEDHRKNISRSLKGRKITWSNKITQTKKKNGTNKCYNTGRTHFKKGRKAWNKGKRMQKIGRKRLSAGYREIYLPKHHLASKLGYVAEHRLIMERYIKRPLKSEEVVHHINGKRADNRINNLMLFKNQSEHQKFRHYHTVGTIICSHCKHRIKLGG